MRLYCRSITLACEAYMGNPGLHSAVIARANARRASYTTTATIHRASRVKNSNRCGIVAGVFVLFALCLTTFLIEKNSRNSSDQTAVAKPETVEDTFETTLSQFLQNQKNKQSAVKKVAFPPPPPTGIELSAKLLENFPETGHTSKGGWTDNFTLSAVATDFSQKNRLVFGFGIKTETFFSIASPTKPNLGICSLI